MLYAFFQLKLWVSTKKKPPKLGAKITICHCSFRYRRYKNLSENSEYKILVRSNFCIKNGSKNKTKHEDISSQNGLCLKLQGHMVILASN